MVCIFKSEATKMTARQTYKAPARHRIPGANRQGSKGSSHCSFISSLDTA